MAEVARCESRFRHLGKSGMPLRGEVNSRDVGVMQINEYYHETTAVSMGLDLRNFEDNMRYARGLYEREGTTPWLSSSKCWGVHNHIDR